MRNGIRFLTVALFALCTQAQADTALGEINIRLYGNIVDFTCVAEGSDSDKTVTLGTGPRNSSAPPGAARSPCRLR